MLSSSIRMRRMNKGWKHRNEGKGESVTWETKTKRNKDGIRKHICLAAVKPMNRVLKYLTSVLEGRVP